MPEHATQCSESYQESEQDDASRVTEVQNDFKKHRSKGKKRKRHRKKEKRKKKKRKRQKQILQEIDTFLSLLFESVQGPNDESDRVAFWLEGKGRTIYENELAASRKDFDPVQAVDSLGFTLLDWASMHGHFHICQYLVAHGADINHQHKETGLTALHHACNGDHVKVARFLIKCGANRTLKSSDSISPEELGLGLLLDQAEGNIIEQGRISRRQDQNAQSDADDRKFWSRVESMEAADSFKWEDEWSVNEGTYLEEKLDDTACDRLIDQMTYDEWCAYISQHMDAAGRTNLIDENMRTFESTSSPPTSDIKSKQYLEKLRIETEKSHTLRSRRRYNDLEKQWNSFVKLVDDKRVHLREIPFPSQCSLTETHDADIKNTYLGFLIPINNVDSSEMVSLKQLAKAVLRRAYLRWHPDKFFQQFGARLQESDRTLIMEKVKEIAQYIGQMKKVLSTLL